MENKWVQGRAPAISTVPLPSTTDTMEEEMEYTNKSEIVTYQNNALLISMFVKELVFLPRVCEMLTQG